MDKNKKTQLSITKNFNNVFQNVINELKKSKYLLIIPLSTLVILIGYYFLRKKRNNQNKLFYKKNIGFIALIKKHKELSKLKFNKFNCPKNFYNFQED